LLALSLPLFLLGILEIGLRIGGYGYSTAFFKKLKIGGENYLVQNDDFALRFFPKETARNPGALRMRATKAAGTIRIFIFGESAAMGDPEPAYGASRYLEVLFREKFPSAKFETVNVAFTAINSHVILPIARECANYDGDIWIVYMANNEMVGPFGAATVFGLQAPPMPLVKFVTAIQKARAGQLFMNLARKFHGSAAKSPSWGGMQMFLENQIAPDNPRKEIVYRNFEENLTDILRAGINAKAKIVLNTVAVNLRDSPPFASVLNSNAPAADRDKFDEALAKARARESQRDFAEAAKLYDEAVKLQTKFADAEYHLGECLLASTNFPPHNNNFSQHATTTPCHFGLTRGSMQRFAKLHPNIPSASFFCWTPRWSSRPTLPSISAARKRFTSMCISISTAITGWRSPGQTKLKNSCRQA